MGWFEKFKKPKKTETQKLQVIIPYCSKCDREIVCLDVSIGEVIEEQGAFIYSGSEGTLYEPMFDGVICVNCGLILCDDCQQDLVDTSRCTKCGGTLRVISRKRLPKT